MSIVVAVFHFKLMSCYSRQPVGILLNFTEVIGFSAVGIFLLKGTLRLSFSMTVGQVAFSSHPFGSEGGHYV